MQWHAFTQWDTFIWYPPFEARGDTEQDDAIDNIQVDSRRQLSGVILLVVVLWFLPAVFGDGLVSLHRFDDAKTGVFVLGVIMYGVVAALYLAPIAYSALMGEAVTDMSSMSYGWYGYTTIMQRYGRVFWSLRNIMYCVVNIIWGLCGTVAFWLTVDKYRKIDVGDDGLNAMLNSMYVGPSVVFALFFLIQFSVLGTWAMVHLYRTPQMSRSKSADVADHISATVTMGESSVLNLQEKASMIRNELNFA